ncbi:MAG: nucleoside kinase [Bacteroidaceae bacterium]|nr:nucleoside kinase [Bacteroidaceae bacterium]
MNTVLQIYCKNNSQYQTFPMGSTLWEVFQGFDLDFPYPVIAAKVNNALQGLMFRVYHNRDVEFLDVRDANGMRVYVCSLCFVLYKATRDVFPGSKLSIEHSISRGYYCSFQTADGIHATSEIVRRIRERMHQLIQADIPFSREEVQNDKAIRIFRECGFEDKVRLLETSGKSYCEYYTLDDTVDYYYGPLVPSTGYLSVWGLEEYMNGMLLCVPDHHNPLQLCELTPQPKTFDVFAENLRWNTITRLSNVGDVNNAIIKGYASELLQVAEALQEKKIVRIAEEIERRFRSEKPVRLVLITGPSSSGKTTFCKRLSIQLLACGIRPISFSTDDYFINRADTPKFPDGRYDFDNIHTVDLPLFAHDLKALVDGEEVDIPEYNFKTGEREYHGKKLKLDSHSVLIIEGIHALNPMLTPQVPDEVKYKIFISALTSVSLDDHNVIPTRDNRLLRRIIRDYNKGAYTAQETIRQWPSVCEGEELWIEPFQENADIMFNSSMNIEFAVMRNQAELILASVPKKCPEYSEAHRLLKFIHYFIPVSDREIPLTSLLREFVGGSSFKY